MEQGLPSPQQSPVQPSGEKAPGEARGWLWGDGSAQRPQHSTQPRSFCRCPSPVAHKECSAAASSASPALGWTPRSAMGKGKSLQECSGDYDRSSLVTGTAGLSPGHFQILHGLCPDWPEPCQGRAPWLTQTLQEATGKETSSTSSPPQPPTHTAALGTGTRTQNAGQDLPAPVQLETRAQVREITPTASPRVPQLQPGSPTPAPSPAGSLLPWALSCLLPQLAEPTGHGSGVGSLLLIPLVPAWKCCR